MQDPWLAAVRQALSRERLGTYHRDGRSDVDALCFYLWNALLCEALYPVLHHLEVTLRNALLEAGAAEYQGAFGQVPCWLDADPPVLLPGERAKVQQVKRQLLQQGKPLEPGRVVAALSFGFWTTLFDRRYEQTRILWPRLFRHGLFAEAPRRLRSRKALSPLLNRVRYLRNRAFHHEPIWHWRDLHEHHAVARDRLGWLCPQLGALVRLIDRFEETRRNGPAAVRLLVDALIAGLAARDGKAPGMIVSVGSEPLPASD